MQPGVRVKRAYYCDVLLLKQLQPDICQAAGDFCFPAHHTCTRAPSCCDTRLRTSHQKWPPNRPDLSSADYRLLIAIQECVCQKQQRMSNIVDELSLLTVWHFINRMTYISQGRVETPTRMGGGNYVTVLLQIYLSICLPKNIKIQCSWTKLLHKNKRVQFFSPHSVVG